MSRINNHPMTSYLLQQGIPLSMIAILEGQRIDNEDLLTIDRDDIEHLFKNEHGFTFAERKRFWNTIQKFQSTNNKNDVAYIEQPDISPDIYEIVDDEPFDCHLTQHYTSSSPSNLPCSIMRYDRLDRGLKTIVVEESSSENHNENLRIATTLVPVCDHHSQHAQSKSSTNANFQYPVQLPIFSPKVTQALETHHIESEWKLFMGELVHWILTKTSDQLKKAEFQAIGQTLHKLYPTLGKDGFRPWSHLCRCLTNYLRKERYRRGLAHPRKSI